MSWGERSCFWGGKFGTPDCPCTPTMNTCNKQCEHYREKKGEENTVINMDFAEIEKRVMAREPQEELKIIDHVDKMTYEEFTESKAGVALEDRKHPFQLGDTPEEKKELIDKLSELQAESIKDNIEELIKTELTPKKPPVQHRQVIFDEVSSDDAPAPTQDDYDLSDSKLPNERRHDYDKKKKKAKRKAVKASRRRNRK